MGSGPSGQVILVSHPVVKYMYGQVTFPRNYAGLVSDLYAAIPSEMKTPVENVLLSGITNNAPTTTRVDRATLDGIIPILTGTEYGGPIDEYLFRHPSLVKTGLLIGTYFHQNFTFVADYLQQNGFNRTEILNTANALRENGIRMEILRNPSLQLDDRSTPILQKNQHR